MTHREDWYGHLPRELIDRAYDADGELAWCRPDALRIGAWLEAEGYSIIGINTWLPTYPSPTPLIDDWNERRGLSALVCIQTFSSEPWHDERRGPKVFFALMAERTATGCEDEGDAGGEGPGRSGA